MDRRVGLRDLLPYLRDHRRALVAIAVLTAVGSALALAQPLLVRTALAAVQDDADVRRPVSLLVAVVLLGAVLGGVGRSLLQRTAEGVVLTARAGLAAHLATRCSSASRVGETLSGPPRAPRAA